MSGTTLNLSLLSRGIGSVRKNGHERVDVVLEPEVGQICSISVLKFRTICHALDL